MSLDAIEEISDEEWEKTLSTNISAMFYIVKAGGAHARRLVDHQHGVGQRGRFQSPSSGLRHNKRSDSQLHGWARSAFGRESIRANAVAPGPVWTPLIPSTMPVEAVTHFGKQVPVKRPAQPCELASVYVMFASEEASYVSGATVAVRGEVHHLAETRRAESARWDSPLRYSPVVPHLLSASRSEN